MSVAKVLKASIDASYQGVIFCLLYPKIDSVEILTFNKPEIFVDRMISHYRGCTVYNDPVKITN